MAQFHVELHQRLDVSPTSGEKTASNSRSRALIRETPRTEPRGKSSFPFSQSSKPNYFHGGSVS